MSYGILFLRVVLGLIMAGHGAQKLFGWWGGPGLQGVHGWLGSMRFRGGWLPVALLVGNEFGGGLLLALGLFTPIAAATIVAGMSRLRPRTGATASGTATAATSSIC